MIGYHLPLTRSPSVPGLSVLASIGPNPAALTELLWELCRQGEPVDGVHIVLESARARFWWEIEGVAAYDELRTFALSLPPRQRVDVVVVDEPEDQSAAFGEAVFQSLGRAQRGARRVIVALSGGRWRGSTALTTTAFQLLARYEDALVDVRISERVAEGGSGFFFPGQSRQELRGPSGVSFRAEDVRVLLDPVPVPRLRPFLGVPSLQSFALALDASRAALRSAEPPELVFDLGKGTVHIAGARLILRPEYLPFYAWVAWARRTGAEAGAADVEGFRAFVRSWERALPAMANPLARRRRGGVVDKLLGAGPLEVADLAPPWSRARSAIALALEAQLMPRRDLLGVATRSTKNGLARETHLELELPPERVVFVGAWVPSGCEAGEL